MKKIYGILAAAGILLAMIPVSAATYPGNDFGQDIVVQEKEGFQQQIRQQPRTPMGASTADASQKYVKVRGIWGYAGDNESDGYFGGRITRKGRFGVFRGLYNVTGNESKGKIVGIMKRGYFNGRLTTPNGSKCHITGLYKIDKENHLLKLRWMTPHKSGWAVARITVPDQ